jgi:uncharacterized protein YjbK
MSKFKSFTVRFPVEDWKKARSTFDRIIKQSEVTERLSNNLVVRQLVKLGAEKLEELKGE